MKLLETTVLGLRLLSIYLLVKSLGLLVLCIATLTKLSEGSDQFIDALIVAGSGFVMFIFAAFICFRFSTKIAVWLLPDIHDQSPVLNGDLETIQVAAFTIIGAFLLAYSLPDLALNTFAVYLGATLSDDNLAGKDEMRTLAMTYCRVFVDLVKIVIGAYMLLGASGLVGILKRLRTPGSHP